ncbi:MAG: hypothetical protein M3Y08_20030 [Fibrobacterota bacterium]|nr:hypothetical protein [Fibrobacterota bacterium]
MSYQVTLNSKNVLVPLSLEDRRGERMIGPLSKLDTATAFVLQVSVGGGFSQEFIPLRICQDAASGYAGQDWELWVQKATTDLYSYYLGVPDRFFAVSAEGQPPRSLSVEVVGTSPLTGREDFSGGVDVTLQAQMVPPLIPGFLNLGDRFFPALLPHNFIEHHALDVFEFAGKRQPVLMTALQMDSADRVPVSLEKHWDPKNWINAVVENLAPTPPGVGGNFAIKGGCFYGRNRKITHWFGGDIGLDEKGFRQAATEKIRTMGQSGNGAWVFWLEANGNEAGLDDLLKDPAAASRRRIAIRHPMMNRFLRHAGPAKSKTGQPGPAKSTAGTDIIERAHMELAARVSAGEAVEALAQVARILVAHQDALQSALAEPSHAAWSERVNPVTAALKALEGGASAQAAVLSPTDGLESDIRDLYQVHGETLRSLEAIFDETYGYSAWDSVGNPMREMLSEYLVAKASDARAPA